MSIEAARVAFLHAAAGGLRLEKFLLGYDRNSRQFLTVTGWHADGAPFATTTATFEGNPIVRGAQLARDVISAHKGTIQSAEKPRVTGDNPPNPAVVGQLNELYRQLAAQAASSGGKLEGNRMSQKGSGLARLMGGLRDLDTNADALASRLEAAMANLTAEMATTQQVVGNVESSVNDLKAVNALYSNGPPSPTPGS
jgi:hypothetical protein